VRKQNKHVGSSLESFLKEEGILEEARAIAIKQAVAWQVQQAMLKENITKVEMAKRCEPAAPLWICPHPAFSR
jgi:antitoxin HicB